MLGCPPLARSPSMLGLPRRSMLRLARPIMIGRDPALARRCAPTGGAPPAFAPRRFREPPTRLT
jgi:hypothetical protein